MREKYYYDKMAELRDSCGVMPIKVAKKMGIRFDYDKETYIQIIRYLHKNMKRRPLSGDMEEIKGMLEALCLSTTSLATRMGVGRQALIYALGWGMNKTNLIRLQKITNNINTAICNCYAEMIAQKRDE